jgi:Lrp/AsnC family leucine-responsive transcriptional regulator
MKLDKTDRRILDVLQRDGRISVTDLAERVGLSATPCARRVRQLEASGFIQGYAAIVDPKRAGQAIQAIVQIKLEQHSDEIVERFKRMLLERPEVLACYTMTGEMDFLLHVIVRDIEALSDFTLRRLLRVAGVRDVKSSIVLETVKRSLVIPLEDLAPE